VPVAARASAPAKSLAGTLEGEATQTPDPRAHATVSRPAAAGAASPSAPVELVVPLAMPRKGTREIVLRIVLTEDDA
jgi:hypothetical protein